ncbi:MAG: CCA tRNA nucleotidyltransferase [Chloroflexi bacterium]|nr:CCA tRNA nucleotidyltransferase [Chloroflexota bacterium]
MSIPIISWSVEPAERAKRLADALSPDRLFLLQTVADAASARGLPLYLVGGFVRDLLLGRSVKDFDLVVEGDAIPLAKALAAQYGGRVTAHARFGTAQWFLPDSDIHALDFISTRSETYKHPAALPTVKPGMLIDDLHRRDFTINTLALRLDGDHFGELRDDLGGLEDLQAGLVRAFHPVSFVDDPTRLFRAVRYEQRYGFQIAPETLALIPDARLLIKDLSAERVRHELDLVLEEENAVSILKRLAELGVLAAVHPALEWNTATQTRFLNGMAAAQTLEHPPCHRSLGWTLWLMDVRLPGLKSIEKRLHFESGLRDMLLAAAALFADVNSLADKKPSRCVAVLDAVPLKAVQAVSLAQPAGARRQELHDYLETWRHVKPKTTGHDLKKRGLPPGPAYQSILQRLREAWLDGEVKTVDEEMVTLEKLIKP